MSQWVSGVGCQGDSSQVIADSLSCGLRGIGIGQRAGRIVRSVKKVRISRYGLGVAGCEVRGKGIGHSA